jgi:hypothetical protein
MVMRSGGSDVCCHEGKERCITAMTTVIGTVAAKPLTAPMTSPNRVTRHLPHCTVVSRAQLLPP